MLRASYRIKSRRMLFKPDLSFWASRSPQSLAPSPSRVNHKSLSSQIERVGFRSIIYASNLESRGMPKGLLRRLLRSKNESFVEMCAAGDGGHRSVKQIAYNQVGSPRSFAISCSKVSPEGSAP